MSDISRGIMTLSFNRIFYYSFLIFFLLWKEPDILTSIINVINSFAIWIGK